MKYVSATVVAVFMPFSAVITGVIAVIIGQDAPTLSLLFGALLGIIASLMSSFGDIIESKKSK
jgi:drug/metabolite transporter (DMT)-like permease